MRSKLTDLELSIIILVISIFTVKPISLRSNPQTQSKIDIFQNVRCQLDRAIPPRQPPRMLGSHTEREEVKKKRTTQWQR